MGSPTWAEVMLFLTVTPKSWPFSDVLVGELQFLLVKGNHSGHHAGWFPQSVTVETEVYILE